MRRNKPMVIIAAAVIALATVGYLRSDIRKHNVFLAGLVSSLNSLPLPPDTRVVAEDSAVGLLAGNGNHCDYLAAQVHTTGLDEESVRSHYEGLMVATPDGSPHEAEIIFLGGGRLPDLEVNADLDLRAEAGPGQQLYVIFVRLIGYHDDGADPRCW